MFLEPLLLNIIIHHLSSYQARCTESFLSIDVLMSMFKIPSQTSSMYLSFVSDVRLLYFESVESNVFKESTPTVYHVRSK